MGRSGRSALAALCALLFAPTVFALETSGSVWVMSDYVWRGVSQTQGDPALQAEFAFETEGGFYAGVWGSNVDFTAASDQDDSIDVELNVFAGWAGDLSESVSLDLWLTHVTYPGHEDGYDYRYHELAAELGFGENLFASVAWSDDLFNAGEAATYYQVGGEWPLGETGFGVRAALGYYDLDDIVGDSYSDVLLALNRRFGPAQFELQYTDTSGYGEALGEITGDPALADGRVALSVQFEF